MKKEIIVTALAVSLALVGCQETAPQKPSTQSTGLGAYEVITEADVKRATDKAVARQREMMEEYATKALFGQKLPRLEGEDLKALLNKNFSKDQTHRVEVAVAKEFERCKGAVVYPAWVKWRTAKVEKAIRGLAESAQASADKGDFKSAHATYEKAREVAWNSVTGAKLEDVEVPEVNIPVRDAAIELLDTYVNPAHWRVIEREMRALALDYAVRGDAPGGIEALGQYPHIRTYTVQLDNRLAAVQGELVRLGLPEEAMADLADKARRAMAEAAKLADNDDVVDTRENKTTLDAGYDPNTEKYRKFLKEYHEALVRYGCTGENADKIVKNFSATLDEMIRNLRRNPRYGKEFMKNIVRLGANAINRRIDGLRPELIDMLKKEDVARSKLAAQIDALLAKGDYDGARALAASLLAQADAEGSDSAQMRTYLVSLVQTKVNPAIWAAIQKDFAAKMEECAKKGAVAEGVAWIAAYPNVRTYAEEIDKRYAAAMAEAVKIGVPEKTAKALVDEVVMMTVGADNLTDYEDRMMHRIVPGKAPDAACRAVFYEELKSCRKALVVNGCTTTNADLLVAALRARFEPEFDRLGEDTSEEILVLGANAINRRLKTLKQESARELIARCATDAVAAGDYTRARAGIKSIALTGNDEFDAGVYVTRVGVLNTLVNPYQYIALTNEVTVKIIDFCTKRDYKGLKQWVTNYTGVHDDYDEVVQSIALISDAATGLGVDAPIAKAYADKLGGRTDRLFEQRQESYARPHGAIDMDELERALDRFEKSVLVQDFQRELVRGIREGVRNEVVALLDHQFPPPMTTWEMNELLGLMKMKLLLAIEGLDLLIANQEYCERLAAMDREFSYDSQIAMAESAIRTLVDAKDGLSSPVAPVGMNAVLGEYIRVMRLLKRNQHLDRDQLTAMLLGAVYLDQDIVFTRALELGADVNGVSPRDPRGRTALLLAIQINHLSFVHRLAEAHAFVKVADAFGSTALHYAARNGSVAAVRTLIDKNDVNAVNQRGETALMDAARLNYPAVVREILAWRGGPKKELKADIAIANNDGQTAFDLACAAGSLDVLDPLAEAGFVCGPRQLALAADHDHLGVAQWLVNHGVDVNGEGVMAATVCKTATKRFLVRQGGISVLPCACRACLEEAQRAREKEQLKALTEKLTVLEGRSAHD